LANTEGRLCEKLRQKLQDAAGEVSLAETLEFSGAASVSGAVSPPEATAVLIIIGG
jgi:hypothetical protein